jgi:AcrR family transcriptional regulator
MSSHNTETRSRILQAALDLLEAGQGAEIRMSDIAKRAGVSRQALYLHFATRAELLVQTTFYLDELKGADKYLAASRAATTGIERLEAFVDAWGGYIPQVYGPGKAMMAMMETDEATAKAWNQRMWDVREGCEAAIKALKKDNTLSPVYSVNQASDLLWVMLSVRSWEQLIQQSGWSQKKYVKTMKTLAHNTFVAVGGTISKGTSK